MSAPTRIVRPDIQRLSPYVPGEQPRGQRVVKLNTNENPYPPSPRVLEAIHAAISGDLRLYPDPVATELRQKAGQVYGFSPESVLVGNGSDELLTMILRATVDPGQSVVFPKPTYSLYETLVAIQGGVCVCPPFPADYRLPLETLGEQGQRVTFICNPNAPSGTLASLDELDSLAKQLRGLLVIDEAYVDFASESALSLVHRHDNVLVLRTFSKSFSLCAMRVGLAFANPELLLQIAKVKDSYNMNRLSQVAAIAALDDYAWMEANAARVRETRTELGAELTRRGFIVLPSHTNFLLARRPGSDLGPLQKRLKEEGVLVRHFATPELSDALRITIGTRDEVAELLAALDRIEA
ncbi:MAG TPA: histidinol-phosphate transaminase [Polyangiaceae bacterium]|nr:histidinol-phosphate transaminase [Polyangiaceae bacterium]